MNRTETISVIMVSWYSGPVLFEAITAALNAPDIHELVLVNHGNTAVDVERLEALAEVESRLKLIHSGGNLGFSRGCNIGAEEATGTHLLFLNPDAILQPGVASRLAYTGSLQSAEPWIVGARLLHPDGREQRGARRGHFNLMNTLMVFSGFGKLIGFHGRLHREDEPLPPEPEDMPTVSGAAMMLSRTGFDQLGGFDESYFLHVEDIDICRRAREMGGLVVFDPLAELVHYGGTSDVGKLFVEWEKAKGLLRYFWRYSSTGGRAALIALAPFLCGAMMSRAAWYAIQRA